METEDTQTPEERAGDPQVGRVIDGRYRILSLVGGGGMGLVYRAEHVAIGRPVALKLIHPELGRDSDFARRFEREAIAMGRLDHPNCIAVSDFGKTDDGGLYLVMELLAGEPLSEVLEREGRLSALRAVRIAIHVLRGLRHAHGADVVHRDLKPENVFLARREAEADFAKILDFGIAKVVGGGEGGGGDNITQTGLAVGTPKYIAPELAFGDAVTPSADLYSVSVLLFEMLAGRAPFDGDDPATVLAMHAGKPVPAIAEIAPEAAVPEGLEALIRRGLAKRRGDRIASADDYLAELESWRAVLEEAPEGRRSSHEGGAAASANVASAPGSEPRAEHWAAPAPAAPPAPEGAVAPPAVSAAGELAAFPSAADASAEPAALTPGDAAPIRADPRAITSGPQNAAESVEPARAGQGFAPHPPPTSATQIVARGGRIGWGGPLKILAAFIAVCAIIGFAAAQPSTEERLQEAVDLLRQGETCEDRREAVHRLHALGDERAVQPLREARERRRGGFGPFGGENTNACLKGDAEEAIRALRGE